MSTGSDRPGDDRLDRPVTREPAGSGVDRDRYADDHSRRDVDADRRADADRRSGLGREDRPRDDRRDAGPRDRDRRDADRREVDRRDADRRDAPATREAHDPALEPEPRNGGKTAAIWLSLILGAIVLILLLIFVIQNNVTATFQYFNAEFDLPLGVAMLLAAIAGALVMALVGSVRMIQMGLTIRKLRRQLEKIQRAVR